MSKDTRDHANDASIDAIGDWPMLEAQLPARWREIADEQGLIDPEPLPHLGAKVTDIEQVLRLVFFHVATNSSLKVTTAMAAAAKIVDISGVALHLWMRKIGSYLATLLELMTSASSLFAPERWAGYDIRVVDATTVTRPGACTTTARVHYALKLTSLQPDQLQVTDESVGETYRHFEAKSGELWMGDRAYANPPGIGSIRASDADVLVRYNRGALPLFDAHGKRIDVLRKVSRTKVNRPREWAVWVHHGDQRIRGRLCVVRLPRKKAEEARARLRKEQGRKATSESLRAAEFVLVFTTAPRDRLSTARVLELYGLRWQVELHIKRDKSIAGLDRLPNFRQDTIFSWICAKLLLTQVARKIASPEKAASPEKKNAPLLRFAA
jgi:hypothetical protein